MKYSQCEQYNSGENTNLNIKPCHPEFISGSKNINSKYIRLLHFWMLKQVQHDKYKQKILYKKLGFKKEFNY